MSCFPGVVRGAGLPAGSSAARDASWFAWSRGRWKTKAMFNGPFRVRPAHPRRTSGPSRGLPWSGREFPASGSGSNHFPVGMEAFLQDADCLAHRVSIKLLLSGRPRRQEQAITAILWLLRVAKRVCLSSIPFDVRICKSIKPGSGTISSTVDCGIVESTATASFRRCSHSALAFPKSGCQSGASQLVGD